MRNYKYLVLLTFGFILVSCKNEKMVIHNKLNLPSETYNTKKFYWEIYQVENIDIQDTNKVNELSNFVLKHFSKQISDTCEYYQISFYEFDKEINVSTDFRKDMIEWKGENQRLHYIWQKGKFNGVTFLDNNGEIISSYVPVKGFERHMKVIERTDKTKNGFNY